MVIENSNKGGARKKYPNGYRRFSLYVTPEKGERIDRYTKIWRKTGPNDTINQCVDYALSSIEDDPVARKEILRLKISENEAQGAAYKEELAEIEREEAQILVMKEQENRKIEHAHNKLVSSWESNWRRMDLMSEGVFSFYEKVTGISVEELKNWLRNEITEILEREKRERKEQDNNSLEEETEEKGSIEWVHSMLLKNYKLNNSKINMMPDSVFEYYAKKGGVSPQELKEWLINETNSVLSENKIEIKERPSSTESRMSVELAHTKLLGSLKNNYNRMDLMPESVWLFYSEQCGVPIDELKKWVREEMMKKGISV